MLPVRLAGWREEGGGWRRWGRRGRQGVGQQATASLGCVNRTLAVSGLSCVILTVSLSTRETRRRAVNDGGRPRLSVQ